MCVIHARAYAASVMGPCPGWVHARGPIYHWGGEMSCLPAPLWPSNRISVTLVRCMFRKSYKIQFLYDVVFVSLRQSKTTWSALIQWPVTQGGNGHFYEVVPAAGG